MKISASIYARASVGDVHSLEATVRALDAHRVDYLHVDCADDPAVFDDIRRIRQWSSTPIDLHLIAADPKPYYPLLRELGIELVSVQAEQLDGALDVPDDLIPRFGWACTAETPIEAFADWRKQLTDSAAAPKAPKADHSVHAGMREGVRAPGFVLFMATTPGKSGGRFDARTFRRIRDFRRRFPGVPIHVDGGVDEEVGFILRNHGVRAAVTGSFILQDVEVDRTDPLGARLVALHRTEPKGLAEPDRSTKPNPPVEPSAWNTSNGLNDPASANGPSKAQEPASSGTNPVSSEQRIGRFHVADFMLQADELPLLPWSDAHQPSFAELLQCIEDHALGFALLQRPDGRLAGLVSNADVRRALLRHLDDLNAVRVADCINAHPFCARSDQNVPKLLQAIKACPFPVAYCPVLDEADRLVGALPFNNLIKGEA